MLIQKRDVSPPHAKRVREFLAPPTGFEPVTNGLLQWTFHFNSFSLSQRAESAALPLSSRPQTSEGTAARVLAGGNRQPDRIRLLKDVQRISQRDLAYPE